MRKETNAKVAALALENLSLILSLKTALNLMSEGTKAVLQGEPIPPSERDAMQKTAERLAPLPKRITDNIIKVERLMTEKRETQSDGN